MSEWQPIETAPKDGRVILLAVDYRRQGHDVVRSGYWHPDRRERWLQKDANTRVRDGWTDSSRWHIFIGFDAGLNEANDEDEGVFVRDFEPTHWMPLPAPPQPPKDKTPA